MQLGEFLELALGTYLWNRVGSEEVFEIIGVNTVNFPLLLVLFWMIGWP
jgi:hypothetical protein